MSTFPTMTLRLAHDVLAAERDHLAQIEDFLATSWPDAPQLPVVRAELEVYDLLWAFHWTAVNAVRPCVPVACDVEECF